jgi:hypothetical protein
MEILPHPQLQKLRGKSDFDRHMNPPFSGKNIKYNSSDLGFYLEK